MLTQQQDTWLPRLRLNLIVSVVAVVAAVIGASQVIELFVNRVLRPDADEWSWISEAILAMALLVVTALWRRLRQARSAVSALERERLIIQTELAVAADVQRALLPAIPAPIRGIHFHAAIEPARQVCGDYYDFFPLPDGRMCVVLADVSGKGIPAAVFVSNIRAVLRAAARDTSAPAALLSSVSEVVLLDGRGTLYVTCFVAIVDAAHHTMVYANAGHPPGVVCGAHPRPLLAGGPPLGLLPDAPYDEEAITLARGDLVVVVSDGVTDAIDASGFGIPTALAAEIEKAGAMTPEAASSVLLAAARNAPGAPERADDRTVVAFGVSDPH